MMNELIQCSSSSPVQQLFFIFWVHYPFKGGYRWFKMVSQPGHANIKLV